MTMRSIRRFSAEFNVQADGIADSLISGSEGPDDDPNAGDASQDGGDGDEFDGSGENEDDLAIGDDGLNAKGRRAIEAERKAADRARNAAKPWRALQREFGMSPDQIREALKGKANSGGQGEGDAGIDPDQIRRDALREASERVNSKIVGLAVAAEAAGRFEDPKDAARYLDFSDYEVDEDGDVDSRQIKRDLDALLRERPYLGKARKGDGRDGGEPDYDGGTRRGTGRPKSMNDIIRNAAGIR